MLRKDDILEQLASVQSTESKGVFSADSMPKPVFCCSNMTPYKPRTTDNEDLFQAFVSFSKGNTLDSSFKKDERAIQVVRQQNFGPILDTRYFTLPEFQETSKEEFQENNYMRLNSFKNYKCATHNLFFEVNAYKANTAHSQHHTSTVDGSQYQRNASDIDLTPGTDKGFWDRKKF